MEQHNELNNVMDAQTTSKKSISTWEKKQIEYKRKLKRTQNSLLFLANLLLALITLFIGIYTIKHYTRQNDVSEKSVEYQNYRTTNLQIDRTIELLDKRDSWYKDYKRYATDVELNTALSWDGYITDEKLMNPIWKKANKEERLNLLVQNMAVRDIFAFFEKVKMLHKKDQIDLDYFFNEIFFCIVRMESIDTTKSPSVVEYLEKFREPYEKNKSLFDGYHYCKDSIIIYDESLKQNRIVLRKNESQK